jgi:hypothetical protein
MEKIMIKIKKLLSLQEGAEKINSLEEAANAAEKIQRLLLKHNLSLRDVQSMEERVEGTDHTIVPASDYGYNKREGGWVASLVNGIAKHNLCYLVITSCQGELETLTILGSADNLEIVTYMSKTLIKMARNMETRAWAYYDGSEKRGKFRRGFLMGFTMGVLKKLRETLEEMQAEDSHLTALVIQNTEALAKAAVDLMGKISHNKSRSRGTSQDGLGQGYKAGRDANVGAKPVEELT